MASDSAPNVQLTCWQCHHNFSAPSKKYWEYCGNKRCGAINLYPTTEDSRYIKCCTEGICLVPKNTIYKKCKFGHLHGIDDNHLETIYGQMAYGTFIVEGFSIKCLEELISVEETSTKEIAKRSETIGQLKKKIKENEEKHILLQKEAEDKDVALKMAKEGGAKNKSLVAALEKDVRTLETEKAQAVASFNKIQKKVKKIRVEQKEINEKLSRAAEWQFLHSFVKSENELLMKRIEELEKSQLTEGNQAVAANQDYLDVAAVLKQDVERLKKENLDLQKNLDTVNGLLAEKTKASDDMENLLHEIMRDFTKDTNSQERETPSDDQTLPLEPQMELNALKRTVKQLEKKLEEKKTECNMQSASILNLTSVLNKLVKNGAPQLCQPAEDRCPPEESGQQEKHPETVDGMDHDGENRVRGAITVSDETTNDNPVAPTASSSHSGKHSERFRNLKEINSKQNDKIKQATAPEQVRAIKQEVVDDDQPNANRNNSEKVVAPDEPSDGEPQEKKPRVN